MTTDRALLAEAAQRLLEMQESLTRDVVARTRTEISALDDDATTRSLLEASVSENIVVGLNFIAHGTSPDHLEAPPAALVFARTLAQRDVPLSALIRAYRIGYSVILDAAFAALEDVPPDVRAPSVIALVQISAQYIDRTVEQVGRTYELERDRWVASVSGVRQQWVNDLLSGRSVDLAEATRVLGYPMETTHLALALWAPADVTTSEVGRLFEEARSRLVRASQARSSLLVPRDDREGQLWLALPADTPRADLAAEELGVGAAQGWPGKGLTGFRSSAAQARSARDLVAQRGGPEHEPHEMIDYTDVAVASLLGADMPALRDVVRHTLGELGHSGARNAMLRQTLTIFLRRHRSYAATAATMNLHRNSVQYRVQQALALLPEPVATLSDDLPLRAALEAAHWYESTIATPKATNSSTAGR